MDESAAPRTILVIDPVTTAPVSEAVRRASERFAIVRVRDAREAMLHLEQPLALLLCRWDPACVEPKGLILAARAARAREPALTIVVYTPAAMPIPAGLIDEADYAVRAASLPALLPRLLRFHAEAIRPAHGVSALRRAETRSAMERRIVDQALAAADGDKAAAARLLEVSRPWLYRRLG